MGKSKATPFDVATDTPTTDSSPERSVASQRLIKEQWKEGLAGFQTSEVTQVLSTLVEPRVPDEGEALWSEFIRINTARGQLNFDSKGNQRETLVIILKLKRYYGPGWSYFLASKKMKRQRNAVSDYHPIVMHALGISADPTGRARPLTVTLDEFERSGKEPDELPEWLESRNNVDGVYRDYLTRKNPRVTKNERDVAVHELSELGPICKIALPHPLAYLDGDYQALVHIDPIQRTLEIRAVDPKVTPAWLRANAGRLVSSRAMLDMPPTQKRPDIPIDTFMTKRTVAAYLYDVTKAKIAEHESRFDRWLEPAAGDGAFFTLLPESSLGIDITKSIEGVVEHDFLAFTNFGNYTYATIGNVPFGKNASLRNSILQSCCQGQCCNSFHSTPRTFRKPSLQNKLDPHFHLIHEEVLPENSFLHMGAEVHVPCVFQIWLKRETKRAHIATPCQGDDLEFLPPNRHHEATIAFQRVGVRAGTIKPIEPDKPLPSAQSHYFIRCDEPAQAILRAIDFHVRYDTAGNPSISKGEILSSYREEQHRKSCDDQLAAAARSPSNLTTAAERMPAESKALSAAANNAGTRCFTKLATDQTIFSIVIMASGSRAPRRRPDRASQSPSCRFRMKSSCPTNRGCGRTYWKP